MKKRVINKKTKKDDLVTKSYLEEKFAISNREIGEKFNQQKIEILGEMKVMFESFTTSLLNGMDSTIKDAVKTFGDENVDIKKRVTVLETKVKVLENN